MIITTTKRALPTTDDLHAVIDRVTGTYHVTLQVQLSRLDRLLTNVAAHYGLSYVKLQPLAQLFIELQRALGSHVADQEQVLFPLLRRLSAHEETHSDALLTALHEGRHTDERIASLFHQISELTGGYDPALDTCSAYQDIVQTLESLDEQTRKHFEAEAALMARLEQAGI